MEISRWRELRFNRRHQRVDLCFEGEGGRDGRREGAGCQEEGNLEGEWEIERRGERMGSQNKGESRRERGERRTRQRGKRS